MTLGIGILGKAILGESDIPNNPPVSNSALSSVNPGNLVYLGSATLVNSSDILVSTTTYPTVQETRDLYHLVAEMSGFDTNYTPEFLYPYEVFEVTNFSDSIYLTTPSFEVTSASRAISVTVAPKSYRGDFYDRVHLSTYDLVLGNILSEQSYDLGIWNAWEVPLNLLAIDLVNLPGVTLEALALPKVFEPLEILYLSLTIGIVGQPIEDGYVTFTFENQVISLHVSGQRVITWPFPPTQAFTERREWLTDVIPAYDGEERYSLREYPRHTLNYTYQFKTQEEYGMATARARAIAGLPVAAPLWDSCTYLGEIQIGVSTLTFDTTLIEFDAVNGIIILWESYDYFEVISIEALTPTSITLSKQTTKAFTKAWILPMKIGYPNEAFNFSRGERKQLSGTLSITSVNGYYDPVWNWDEEYLGLPVITTASVVTGGLGETIVKEQSPLDSSTGLVTRFDLELNVKPIQRIRLAATTKQEKWTIKRQIDYLQGKFNLFWLPSFNLDLIAASDILATVDTITIEYADWNLYGGRYIRIIGSVTDNFEVTNVVLNPDGTETLTLSPTPTRDIKAIRSIQTLLKVRLDSDSVEYVNETPEVLFITAPVKEVP